jgi:outer membrane protein assembly factor BamB
MMPLRFVPAFTAILAFLHGQLVASPPKHRVLAADSSKSLIAIIREDGSTEWEMKIGPLHDLHWLENEHLLMQTSWTRVVEVDTSNNQVVWEYDAASQPDNANRKVEIHAFQRLSNQATLISESGATRLLEIDQQGKRVANIPLLVSKPHPHRDTRLVRRINNGNFLVCHEGDGIVKEYAADGKIVWSFEIPLFDRKPAPGHGPEAFGNQCFCALRLKNGNTLISTGNGHRVLEIAPDKRIVWQLQPDDLLNIQLGWLTTLQVLPSGNIVIGNCHAGESNPQVIEVTRDKQIVWAFRDFDRFGNALTNTQILSTDGTPVQAVVGQDR